MAIRGVGTLFGEKQSGEMDSIGADLYQNFYEQLEKIEMQPQRNSMKCMSQFFRRCLSSPGNMWQVMKLEKLQIIQFWMHKPQRAR